MEYKRNCPKCSAEIIYVSLYSFNRANRLNRKCNVCRYANGPWNKGLHANTDERVKKYVNSPTNTKWKKDHIPWNKGKKLHYKVWNKGLTKNSDNRIKDGPWKNKKIPKHVVDALVKGRKNFYKNNPDFRAKFVRISKPQKLLFEECKRHFDNVKLEFYHNGYFIDILVNDKLAIEVDGAHWHGTPEAKEKDSKRDKIVSKTYKVIRFDAEDVRQNYEKIVENISLL